MFSRINIVVTVAVLAFGLGSRSVEANDPFALIVDTVSGIVQANNGIAQAKADMVASAGEFAVSTTQGGVDAAKTVVDSINGGIAGLTGALTTGDFSALPFHPLLGAFTGGGAGVGLAASGKERSNMQMQQAERRTPGIANIFSVDDEEDRDTVEDLEANIKKGAGKAKTGANAGKENKANKQNKATKQAKKAAKQAKKAAAQKTAPKKTSSKSVKLDGKKLRNKNRIGSSTQLNLGRRLLRSD